MKRRIHISDTPFPLVKTLAVCQYVVMVCVYCSNKTQVTNSRPQKRPNNVWRRRQCLGCQAVFTTVEAPDLSQNLIVTTDKAKEPFSRDRLLFSVYEAINHRTRPQLDAAALTDTVIAKIIQINSPSITSAKIADIVYDTLNNFDKLAALKYKNPAQ